MIRLDEWIATHGALWPTAALVMILDAAATATRLDDRRLSAAIGSLTAAGVERRSGRWAWVPAAGAPGAARVRDVEVIERLGAILFSALSGEARVDLLATERTWRASLRAARPELSNAVVDLTIRALSARRQQRRGGVVAFAREVRVALGIEHQSRVRTGKVTFAVGAVLVAALFTGAAWWSMADNGARIGSNGLTADESKLQDLNYELATSYALVDEHTAAFNLYQQVGRTWRARLAPNDPRLAWELAHEAWVRTLAGDRFTTEQLIEDAPDWFSRELGHQHPYTRAVRLELAETLVARGADDRAATLRAEAERATNELFHGSTPTADLLPGVPAPPGVIAHVSPNAPEREGFRAAADGGFFAPLTSLQRFMSERDGWRLHVAATGPCQTSVTVGNVPRRITLAATRDADKRWRVQVQGASTARAMTAAPADSLLISLIADRESSLRAKVGDAITDLAIDTSRVPTDPPYALAFSGGCAIVWLEIAFPYQPGAKVTQPLASR
jgi:hypothetical protein